MDITYKMKCLIVDTINSAMLISDFLKIRVLWENYKIMRKLSFNENKSSQVCLEKLNVSISQFNRNINFSRTV